MRGRFGGGDFAGAFHVPPPGGGGADHSGFGHMQAVPGRDLDSADRQLVPAPKLRKRYAEAVSDRDQSVAAARGVVEGVGRWGSGRRYRHNERFNAIKFRRLAQIVGASQLSKAYAVSAGNRGHGVVRVHLVISPGIASALGDGRDLLLEECSGAGRQVKVESGLRRRDQAQKARIEGDKLVNWRTDNVRDQAKVG